MQALLYICILQWLATHESSFLDLLYLLLQLFLLLQPQELAFFLKLSFLLQSHFFSLL